MPLARCSSTGAAREIIERDDGFLGAVKPVYFAPVTQWPAVERRAPRWVRGRVLDASVGAGRAALELQRRGRSIVGIDVSPGAVEVARGRGVRDARLLAFASCCRGSLCRMKDDRYLRRCSTNTSTSASMISASSPWWRSA